MTEENLTKLVCTAGSLGDFQDMPMTILPQFPPPAFVNFPFSPSCSDFTVSFWKE